MKRKSGKFEIIGGAIDPNDKEWKETLLGDGTKASDLVPEEADMVTHVPQKRQPKRDIPPEALKEALKKAAERAGEMIRSGTYSKESAYDFGKQIGQELAERMQRHEEFEAWKDDDEKLKNLLEGSKVFVKPWDREVAWRDWEAGRRYIADVVTEDGTILDYGCANGFLLRSLQEWTDNRLDPYGYDTDPQGIAKAHELYPEMSDHFVHPGEKAPESFPKEFDYVYWNVWDNWHFKSDDETQLLQELLEKTKPGGRLILGMYDDPRTNTIKIEKLRERGFIPNAVIENHHGKGVLVIFDKPAEKK